MFDAHSDAIIDIAGRDVSKLFKDKAGVEEAADVRDVSEQYKDKDVVVRVSTDVKSETKTEKSGQPAADVFVDEGM